MFKVGDPDENVFIVQSGLISVNITSIDGSIIPLKLVKTGDCVTSLLSFTDVLTVSKNTSYVPKRTDPSIYLNLLVLSIPHCEQWHD